jgi:hypothetical protein
MAGTGKAHNTSISDNNRSGAAATVATLGSPMRGLAATDAVAEAGSELGVCVINWRRHGAEELDRAA